MQRLALGGVFGYDAKCLDESLIEGTI